MAIVVGHTSTSEGKAALDRAVEEARLRAAPLHVVRVVQIGSAQDPNELASLSGDLAAAEAEGRAIETRLRDEGIDATVLVQLASSKPPSDILLEVAQRVGARLIVIGMRTRSRVGKLILGSVAQDIILAADCPVLTVKVDG